MASRRVIPRRRTSTTELPKYVQEYLNNRSMRERSEYWEKRFKSQLMDVLEEAGELQENGDRTLALDEPLTYHQYKGEEAIEKSVVGIKRQVRRSTHLNEDRTISVLVLGSSSSGEGPGPLVTAFAGKLGSQLRIPLTIVPGRLTEAEIDAIS